MQLHVSFSDGHYRAANLMSHLADVNPGCLLSLCVPVTQLCYCGDGIKTSVLCQRRGDDLEGICICAHAVRLHASQRAGVFCQPQRQLDLWCSTASDQSSAGAQENQLAHQMLNSNHCEV